jgi:hypothetical protein
MGDLLAGFVQMANAKISSGPDNDLPFAFCDLPFAILFGLSTNRRPKAGIALPT